MKRLSYVLAGFLLALPFIASGQNSSLWKLVGTRLRPVSLLWSIEAPRGFSGSTISISGLKSCNTIDSTSTGMLICGNDATGAGGGSNFGTGNVVTIGDSKYVNIGGDTMTGALAVRSSLSGSGLFTLSGYRTCTLKTTATGMTVCGTDTDTTYTAGQGLTLNGTSFRMNAAITGSSIMVAGTVSGSLAVLSSLRSCTLKTGGTGNVICGSDLNSDLFNTGSILSAGDRKYVNIGGDTMTGTLTVTPVSGVALNAQGTISGSLLTQNGAGNNYFLGNVGIGTTSPGVKLVVTETAASTFPMHINGVSAGTAITNVMGPVIANTDSTTGNWAGLLFSDAVGGAASGLMGVKFTDHANNYGDFAWGTRSAGGFTEKMRILSTGEVGIGTDAPKTKLEVLGTVSGSTLYAASSLRSSGSLVWEGAASGATLWVSKFDGAGLVDCDLTTNKVLWDTTLDRFSCGTDLNTDSVSTGALLGAADRKYVNLGGDTMTGALIISVLGGNINSVGLEVINTISGSVLHANTLLRSSGSLVTESGAYIDSTTLVVAAGPNRVGIGTATPKSTLEVVGAVSGSIIRTNSLNSSGSLTVEGTTSGAILYISRNSTLSAANITFSASGQTVFNARQINTDLIMRGQTAGALFYLDASADRIGINKTDPRSTLDVNGTISGSIIRANTISGSTIRSQFALSPTCIPFALAGTGTALTTGSGKLRLPIPYTLSGFQLGIVKIFTDSSGVGGTTGLQIRNASKGFRKLLSTVVSIDSTESGSTTAATPYVVNTSNDDVGGDDALYFDITSIHSTRAAKGLTGYTCWYKP